MIPRLVDTCDVLNVVIFKNPFNGLFSSYLACMERSCGCSNASVSRIGFLVLISSFLPFVSQSLALRFCLCKSSYSLVKGFLS